MQKPVWILTEGCIKKPLLCCTSARLRAAVKQRITEPAHSWKPNRPSLFYSCKWYLILRAALIMQHPSQTYSAPLHFRFHSFYRPSSWLFVSPVYVSHSAADKRAVDSCSAQKDIPALSDQAAVALLFLWRTGPHLFIRYQHENSFGCLASICFRLQTQCLVSFYLCSLVRPGWTNGKRWTRK